ncbi:MAG TPA: tRNA uracil 4-sulfurtransferase ThiI [Vicinamibacteria bacterium]|nr:tRNA uracil 4-sulfurtransferase ThiI [Vicinamibacteria bacterium]
MNVVLRYHEIALKGRNRPFFVERLAHNARRATSDLGGRVQVLPGRLRVCLPDGVDWEEAERRLSSLFGVANFSRTHETRPEMAALEGAAAEAVSLLAFSSFRVTARRSAKSFPLTSPEIERRLGAVLHEATGVRVDLEHPDLTVYVEVLGDRILYSFERRPGPGGFPVGTSGRVVALLSGGIDSPVAAWRMMKRGCTVVPVHFHAFPLQDHTTIDKVTELSRLLTRWQLRTRLLLVPFAEVQQTIVASCPAPLRVVLYRRFMVRIAEVLAARRQARALVTGESLGQVASQTLDNMAVVGEAARGLVMRPLVGMDKDEITQQARRIGTFEVSTLPDQDCCQLFVPRSPATAASLDEVRRAESVLDVAALVQGAARQVVEERFEFPPVAHPTPDGATAPARG